MSELKGKLAALDERRTVAERELEKLTHHQEQIAELEREAEALKALGIKVIAYPDGSIELTGRVFVDVHSDKGEMIPNEEYHALAR